MRPSQISGIALAGLLAVNLSAFAQTPPAPSQRPDIPDLQTYTGCVMTESDYRRAHNLGGGTAGGAGLGDEFVLVDAKVSPAGGAVGAAPPSTTGAAASSTKTAGKCADQGAAYRLTGSDEKKVKAFVGRQLEVQGRLKLSGTAPTEKLPAEVEIISFRAAPR